MGYTTEFKGKFSLNKELDNVTFEFLNQLANTRRMKRNLPEIYGYEGEFFTEGTGYRGQDRVENVIDFNNPPYAQPGLWCGWIPTKDRLSIEWDGGEKFYGYIEWIEYIISKILAPRGYILSGVVKWRGEDFDDIGEISIIDNMVNGKRLIVNYSINKLLPLSTSSTKKTGVTKDGKKTRHQIAKEKIEAEKKELEERIKSLEDDLKQKTILLKSKTLEEKVTKKLTVRDLMLTKIKTEANIKGSLEDFKVMLKNLLEE